MIRRLIAPTTMSLVFVQCDSIKTPTTVCKPRDLPLYQPRKPKVDDEPCEEPTRSSLETAITSVRHELTHALDDVTNVTGHVSQKLSQIPVDFEDVATFLRAEENAVPRYGAVAVGGLTGFFYGAIRGRVRKYLYTAVGAAAMAALCYPTEAAEYTHMLRTDSRKYIAIAYNFVMGVKPGEERPLPELPKIPTSLSDVKGAVTDVGVSIMKLVKGNASDQSGNDSKPPESK